MKTFYHLLAALAATTTLSAAACQPVSEAPAVETNVTNPVAEKSDTIESFRFELYQGGQSAVYYYSTNLKYNNASLYSRDLGSSTGWNYTVATDYINAFSKLARDLKLHNYPYTELNDEDKNRDRWLIEVEYTNGKHASIVNYLTEANKDKDDKICKKAVDAFKAVTIKDKDGKMLGEYSKTEYLDGKRVKEVFYTPDGIVRGGEDYTLPNDVPPAEYGVPQAPGKLY